MFALSNLNLSFIKSFQSLLNFVLLEKKNFPFQKNYNSVLRITKCKFDANPITLRRLSLVTLIFSIFFITSCFEERLISYLKFSRLLIESLDTKIRQMGKHLRSRINELLFNSITEIGNWKALKILKWNVFNKIFWEPFKESFWRREHGHD